MKSLRMAPKSVGLNMKTEPFYLYDERGIRASARALLRAFDWARGFKEYFALKATPNPYILKLLRAEGCGADCSSYAELLLAERTGISGHEILVSLLINFLGTICHCQLLSFVLESPHVISLNTYEDKMATSTLLAVEDSVLIVIDVQSSFLRKLPPTDHHLMLQRICWLIGVANWLRIPIIATAEDIPREGSVAPEIAAVLPPNTPIYNKMVFDLAAESAIRAAVAETGRKTAVLVGLETDVCVAQSALGLLARGYQVVVVANASAAPGRAHSFGIDRAERAGALIVGVKNLFYEWVRTVEQARRFRRECAELGQLEGIQL
jgi:nicotinamidase-related amidase